MVNQEHLDRLKLGVETWNKWRKEYPNSRPNLSGATLSKTNLSDADLKGADLSGADLSGATLREANLSAANLSDAKLGSVDLSWSISSDATLSKTTHKNVDLFKADLSDAILKRAQLIGADLSKASLSRADLSGAKILEVNLSRAILVETNLTEATLTQCTIYGISVWNVELTKATQNSLVITPDHEPAITVDNLKIAQFIYLLLNNEDIRDVINVIGQKGVLILGRFTPERKLVLDALREKLRTLNFLPIVFDFEHSTERDFTETIMTLAGLSCFIIADITNPKSTPLELQATVPNYMIPFVPIIQKGEQPFSMFQDLEGKYDWVLDILEYDSLSNLIKGFEKAVVSPALEKRDKLLTKKMEKLRIRHIGDYLL